MQTGVPLVSDLDSQTSKPLQGYRYTRKVPDILCTIYTWRDDLSHALEQKPQASRPHLLTWWFSRFGNKCLSRLFSFKFRASEGAGAFVRSNRVNYGIYDPESDSPATPPLLVSPSNVCMTFKGIPKTCLRQEHVWHIPDGPSPVTSLCEAFSAKLYDPKLKHPF